MLALSKLLNGRLHDPVLFPDEATREWFKLFTHMDDDRSGMVSYTEFSGLCREELKMKKSEVRTGCCARERVSAHTQLLLPPLPHISRWHSGQLCLGVHVRHSEQLGDAS